MRGDSAQLYAAIRPIRHQRGATTFRHQAVVLILTAEDAIAIGVAVVVFTAPAQRGRRRRRPRYRGRNNNGSEQRSRKSLHNHLRFSRLKNTFAHIGKSGFSGIRLRLRSNFVGCDEMSCSSQIVAGSAHVRNVAGQARRRLAEIVLFLASSERGARARQG